MKNAQKLYEAESNLVSLSRNYYPGRGIICGLDEKGEYLIQVYWIMGRGENSRNRVFEREGGRLFTVAADPAKVEDPSLIIYNAMREEFTGGYIVSIVSNGSQTDAAARGYANDWGPVSSLSPYSYEPDAPNFTPRITAISFWPSSIQMSILRKSPWSNECDRIFYEFGDLRQGCGYCITTYSGDGDPLPSFKGEPYLLPLDGDIDEIINAYWKVLNPENKVSLAVKFIPKHGPSEIRIINKFSRVQ